MVLATIGLLGVAGGTGHVLEYRGDAISELSMDGRMTICNMSIEAGARAGLIAPDETTFAYLEGRPGAPQGAAWEAALEEWRELRTDDGAVFDRTLEVDLDSVSPQVTWGTNPGMVTDVRGVVPDPADSPTRLRGRRPSVRSSTWGSSRARRSARSSSTGCSSARAPTRGSRICAPRRASSRASAWRAA